ncbi:MAG: carbamoyl-phosphate synthase large subunit [Alphaproteobacteria bacterium PA2]|nr:MAG: carbamoyl-phosphate synthase large subunit [Alphaproteobacteria bacterium PA2]
MTAITRLLIANRGEIAIRISRAAQELGITAVAIFSEDDGAALHGRLADEAIGLKGVGPRAYLDIEAVVAAAIEARCDAVHPGYGFLAENPAFARACAKAGLTFVGPDPETLELFGDKAKARELAASLGVPLAPATAGGASLEDIRAFKASFGADIMIKAVAGGGGRGMRAVSAADDPAEAYEICAREAVAAFGDGRLFAERFVGSARHIEVQILGDGIEAVAIHDRECSIQRRNQKIIEVAPAPNLSDKLRARLTTAAVDLARAAKVRGLTTMEFLLDAADGETVLFIEANPRLQVEHTVTEAVTGLDLVQLQLAIAAGATIKDLGLAEGPPVALGFAIELRVNLETLAGDGSLTSTAGAVIGQYEPPSGPGVRVDGYGYGGYRTNPSFDSLIAKLIVHSPSGDFAVAAAKALRAVAEFRLTGPGTNLGLLQALLERAEVRSATATTGFIEANLASLAARALELTPVPEARDLAAGVSVAVVNGPSGTISSPSPMRATVVGFEVAEGDTVRIGQTLAVLEAMKMQHVVAAAQAGVVRMLASAVGDVVDEGQALVFIEPGDQSEAIEARVEVNLDSIRPDLAAVLARQALTLDEARPDSVARRRKTGQRTARENLGDLFDPGSFNEYGALAIAAQKRRRSLEDLRSNTPADGIITGVGEVNGHLFPPEVSRCVGLAYDFTVLAGTQGHFSHKKTDRILEFAEHWKTPIVWFTEGGGGRPGDVDVTTGASSLDTTSFTTFARLSGNAPRIAVNSGRCFAGNAVFFGCADITIATRYSNIGLGGPAMVEGGGLGVFTADEIGPSEVQWKNGVLDVLVEDEAEAVAATKQILSCFQGAVPTWSCPDQRKLRHLIPENRVRVYDVKAVIETLADDGSWIELRGGYGQGMITGFLRVEGRPMGVIANDPRFLGGAIDGEGGEKAGRFMQMCDAFGVPILSLCDTPGFMVGPDSEIGAGVRRGSRMFVVGASLRVPFFTVVLRKGYGLGAQAMSAGDFSAPAMIVAWPTAEFGPMGLEGAVRLGYRKELEAEPDLEKRQAMFDARLARMYEAGKAVSVAEVLEIDAVIDPKDTRAWLSRGLKACPVDRSAPRRSFVDVW